MKNIWYLFIVLIIFESCSTSTAYEENPRVHFSSMEDGQAAITKDSMENFFDIINKKDIELQIKRDVNLPLDSLKELYKDELRNSILEFNEADRKKLNHMFFTLEDMLRKINPDLLLDSVNLIKIDPSLYGSGVFYTRDNSIIIPFDRLENYNANDLFRIIIHEYFHILSRYNKNLREKLYGLINYKKLYRPLSIPHELNERILLNPDGLEKDWYIDTKKGYQIIKLVPLLYARDTISSDYYFENMELRFYQAFESLDSFRLRADHYFLQDEVEDLYKNIGDNTDYIIHPDEVLADNFVFALYAQESPEMLDDLSQQGKQLVLDLIETLKNDN